MFGGDAKENAGGSGGLAATLFSVAQCCGVDAKGGRELRLTELELGTDGGDGFRCDVIDARGERFVSAQVGSGFADALQ